MLRTVTVLFFATTAFAAEPRSRILEVSLGESIGMALKKLLPTVSEENRLNFVVNLIGGAGDDKVASMVHL